jgi:serine/threonine-protein kinase
MSSTASGTVRTIGDRYDIIAEIGRGGMATVYRARDRRHDRDVAIKILDAALCDAIGPDRFLREIQIEARLQHPHIIGLFDSGSVDGCPYYAMPYVEGESLRARLARERQLPVPEALRIAREVASALSYAHQHGVIHRDVKPANILLSSGVAMLADFGIARAATEVGGDELTQRGIVIGSPPYMSPEQASGSDTVDARSDVYSLGCVVYEMLAGEPPFGGRTTQAIMARHILERVPSLEVVRPGIPPGIAKAIEQALAKTPADRFATSDQFVAALDRAASGRASRRPVVIGAAGGAAALVLAAAAFWPRTPDLDRSKVVVFPLEERGVPPTDSGAGTDVAVMIISALEHADPLRPLDIRDRLSPEQSANAALVTAERRRSLARDRGAGVYTTGIIQMRHDSTTVILRLYDVAGDSLIASSTVGGTRAQIPLHRLGIDAVKELIPSLVDPGRQIDLTPIRDRSAGTIALYVQGEREYRRSNFRTALVLYERALGADSAMALAAVKGAQAASWVNDTGRTAALLHVAIDRDSLLPARYGHFARGWAAKSAGNADSALIWLERAERAAPGWAEALMALGETYYHLVPLRPRLDSLAEAAFNAALASDSGFTPPLYHLTEIAIRAGNLSRAQTLFDRFERERPSAVLLTHLRLMLECSTRGARNFDWTSASTSSPREVLTAAKALSAAGRGLACADGGFRSLLLTDSTEYHWGAFMGHHAVLAATGQHGQLVTFVDSTVKQGTVRGAMMAYMFDTAGGIPVGPQAQGVVASGQGRWGKPYEALHEQPGLEWILWLFGVWHAQHRDSTTLRVLVDAMDRSSAAGGGPRAALYAAALRAHLQVVRGDTTAAIAQYRALSPILNEDDLEWDWGGAFAIERLELAKLLLARGEHRAARDVASLFDHQGPITYLILLPESLAIRYQAAIAMGNSEAAQAFRQRLTELGRAELVEVPR